MAVSKKFLHFSKHHFPKDSESGLKSRKISSLSFLPDLKHPNTYLLWNVYRIKFSVSNLTPKIIFNWSDSFFNNFMNVSFTKYCSRVFEAYLIYQYLEITEDIHYLGISMDSEKTEIIVFSIFLSAFGVLLISNLICFYMKKNKMM